MILLIGAAIFYTVPFYIQSLWWIIFFFPPLLLYSIQKTYLSLQSIIIWSFIVSIAHFFPMADALYCMASGPCYMKIMPGIVLVLVCSLYISIWLFSTSYLVNKTKKPIHAYCIWTISLWIFLVFIDQYLFWTWGRIEGNVCMNPLLPLLQSRLIQIVTSTIGINPTLFVFGALSSTLTLSFKKKNMIITACLILLLVPFPSSINKPAWLTTVGHLPLYVPPTSSCTIITYRIAQLKKRVPSLSLIILPESSTSSCPSSLSEIPIIVGSFESHTIYRFNTLYYVSETKKELFHKRLPVPFTEYLPPLLAQKWITKLMFASSLNIHPSNNSRPRWVINSDIALTPYICSELFSAHLPDDSFSDTILVVCNDLWFSKPHFKLLMASAARLRALQWQRPILYVSYAYGQFFDQFGNIHPIATTGL